METTEWIRFWKEYGEQAAEKDSQSQVLRTLNKQPIAPLDWNNTLNYLTAQLEINPADVVLDLCCGNGLIAQHLAPKCNSVTAIDVSEHLLDQIDIQQHSNITVKCQDIRSLEFEEHTFSKIVFYAGVQYFTLQETVVLFNNFMKWLKPGGILFLGDIPDEEKRWTFFNTPEREGVYFDAVLNGRDIVGTWFHREWLKKLGDYSGLRSGLIIDQAPYMIYSFFRYDAKFVK
jgi:cyclopropane fatty-acyl-phospholipid synthase-like methyltransferase